MMASRSNTPVMDLKISTLTITDQLNSEIWADQGIMDGIANNSLINWNYSPSYPKPVFDGVSLAGQTGGFMDAPAAEVPNTGIYSLYARSTLKITSAPVTSDPDGFRLFRLAMADSSTLDLRVVSYTNGSAPFGDPVPGPDPSRTLLCRYTPAVGAVEDIYAVPLPVNVVIDCALRAEYVSASSFNVFISTATNAALPALINHPLAPLVAVNPLPSLDGGASNSAQTTIEFTRFRLNTHT